MMDFGGGKHTPHEAHILVGVRSAL